MWIKTYEERYVNCSKWDSLEIRSISLDDKPFCYEIFLVSLNDECSISYFEHENDAIDYMDSIMNNNSFANCKSELNSLKYFLSDYLEEINEYTILSTDNFENQYDERDNYMNKIINSKRIEYGRCF